MCGLLATTERSENSIATAKLPTSGKVEGIGPGRRLRSRRGRRPAPSRTGASSRRGLALCPNSDRAAAAPDCSALLIVETALRTLLIHGARSALGRVRDKQDPTSLWLGKMRLRRHPNIVAVALANKNARIAWSLLSSDSVYDPGLSVAQPDSKIPSERIRRVGLTYNCNRLAEDGETVTPPFPEPGVWTGMAPANALASLRRKRAKIHRGSRR